jgi:hypothetical protein
MQPLVKDAPPYPKGTIWADPDIEHAAELMTRLVADPEMGHSVGTRAQQDIRTSYSAAVVGQLMRSRVEEIYKGFQRSWVEPVASVSSIRR